MLQNSIWITGSTRSGKTTRLVDWFRQWVEGDFTRSKENFRRISRMTRRDRTIAPAILVFAANDDNRRDLGEQLTLAIQGRYPVRSKTPLGFFQDEVMLFWPLLIEPLHLKAQFPLRLRPETEQELATQLWLPELEQWDQELPGASRDAKVRRILDLLLLAAVSGTPTEDIPSILTEGMVEEEGTPELWDCMGQLLLKWRQWCLERGLLTYGIICELYWRYLLPNATYQEHLKRRYRLVLADDVDDYPAIARDLFDRLLDQGAIGAFTYNPNGKVRLGLNADPHYLEELASRCEVETLDTPPVNSLVGTLGEEVVELVSNPLFLTGLPESIQSIQTTSRAALLRQTADAIAQGVKSGQVEPGEIAVIAPGLDPIARYVLTDILSKQGIAVEPLNDQRPLVSSPMIRALLTLLAFVYPGLGRLIDRDSVAEMLVVLSQKQEGLAPSEDDTPIQGSTKLIPHIDTVRAGLLADYCYRPDPENPCLLPVESFQRWDRLGHRATAAYSDIMQWLDVQRSQQKQRLIPSCLAVLDRAIQKFLWNGSNLPYEQLSALRELMETAQHYWDVDGRLRQESRVGTLEGSDVGTLEGWQVGRLAGLDKNLETVSLSGIPAHTTIGRFIQMLRRGTVTANPYPVRRLASAATNAVTLATIFQYRANRHCHRWHFWLDAGSRLWELGGAATLFAAPLFLNERYGRPWTEEDKQNANEERLQRILRDLLGRVSERVYLCHSDLAVNGTEQAGPLLTLVHTAVPVSSEAIVV